MAVYYGTLKGNRGEVNRQGTKESGIKATAQSWDGSVSVRFFEDEGITVCEIKAGTGSTPNPTGKVIYRGPLSKLL